MKYFMLCRDKFVIINDTNYARWLFKIDFCANMSQCMRTIK